MSLERTITISSLATLAGLVAHYAVAALWGSPLLTDAIAEWIMARTPSRYAVWMLSNLGTWAKPLAATGGLATLGFAAWLFTLPQVAPARLRLARAAAVPVLATLAGAALAAVFEYESWTGLAAFLLPAVAVVLAFGAAAVTSTEDGRSSGAELCSARGLRPRWLWREPKLPRGPQARPTGPPADSSQAEAAASPARRQFLTSASRLVLPVAMGGGVVGVALESYWRDAALARKAVDPVDLFPFVSPVDTFGEGLIRKPVTPVAEFYGMSKNTVDPAVDPGEWRMKITVNGRPLREFSYQELLSLPRREEYVSLRCVSNTLQSNLMGTAQWSGVRLSQLVDRARLPESIVEAAFIGIDGHDDSLPVEYAFSDAVMLALGMNGQTLDRTHGFPIRLLAPRYYGFKHVKWIAEIAFVSEPYFGTWPKMDYTKQPVIHTVSYIDRIVPEGASLRLGGIAMTGHGGIRDVELRADRGAWVKAEIEPPLSPYTWTRWKGAVPAAAAQVVQARAMDARGQWQAEEEGQLFPDGVKGPTIRKVP